MRGLYLQTEVTQEQLAAVAASNPGVPERVLARVERDRSFIVHLLRSLLDDLRPDFRRRALFRGLEAMLAKAEAEGREIDVNAATAVEKSWTKGERRKLGGGVGGKVNPLSLTVEGELSRDREWQERYTDLVIKGLDHQKYVRELGELLRASKVDHLYVFLDDFSEVPAGAMRTLVDTVIAPLNNSSDSPIRFKIAAYPYQIYLGAIDPTKIDVVELDIDRLYSGPRGSPRLRPAEPTSSRASSRNAWPSTARGARSTRTSTARRVARSGVRCSWPLRGTREYSAACSTRLTSGTPSRAAGSTS